ncbi:gamma-mobile-trio protein GmtX [Acinetobacter pittii]|uniref:gamma-mobile-trio protein GmtX n=1 Tax=Acinetobacter pittii TaxID=48296 RepID=UPI0021CD954E|nr:gamma-mobile-trio protein GmtX [Acinetobacter pittii]MCU4707892.1 gamma-mobile-trio protein GmtX [Acinetobacter pittii]
MNIEIDVFLENLKLDKSSRTEKSLDQLNSLLKAHYNSGEKDFSIATIGRISKANNGIGTVSIRNKSGEHFRLLIEAWATKANTTMKKPHVESRVLNVPTDFELLKRLEDPALRAVFGQIIAEKKKLRLENNILKKNAEVFVDMRPKQILGSNNENQSIEVLPALSDIFLPSEIEALRDAIDKKKMEFRGLTSSESGVVKDENGRILFKVGFITAIKKILMNISAEID